MAAEPSKIFQYKRARFSTPLPVDFLYSPSHYWIARHEDDLWRVGLTKFAGRMLGEMVEYGFETQLDAPVSSGQILGWVEGFKAVSDVFCIATGKFAGTNPALEEKIDLITTDPYREGWIYAVRGQPDSTCIGVQGYCDILDKTIDRLIATQKSCPLGNDR
jgi:glycine cleavage system H protein